jgi:hypothetical protein
MTRKHTGARPTADRALLWRGLAPIVGCVIFCATTFAHAAEKAQSLYDQGLAEMLEGRFETGCPLLERSYADDPLPGAGFTLAACYARWGKVNTAAVRYRAFLAMVEQLPPAERDEQKDRVKAAREKLAELEPQIPTITLSLGASAGADVIVQIDGRTLRPTELGSPVPVDPGEHEIAARRPDEPVARQTTVQLEPGAKREVDLSDLLAQAGEAPAAAAEAPDEEGPDDGTTLRAAGIAVGAVGLAGIVVGAITGGMVFGKKSTVEDNCIDTVCNQEGLDAADQASTLGMVSNVGFGVGVGALALGVVLYLVAPDGEGDSEGEAEGEGEARLLPSVGLGPTGRDGAMLGLTGRW